MQKENQKSSAPAAPAWGLKNLAVDPLTEDPWLSIYSKEWVAKERAVEYGDSVKIVELSEASNKTALHEKAQEFEYACASEIKALRDLHDYLEGISGSLMTPTLQQLMARAEKARNTLLAVKGKLESSSNSPVRYEIRQQVRSVAKRWIEVVHKGEFERPLLMEYERLTREYPKEYFELVRVSTEEACLAFTPKFA